MKRFRWRITNRVRVISFATTFACFSVVSAGFVWRGVAFMGNLIFVYGRFCRCRYILQCYVQSRPSSNLQVASASCAIRFVYWSLGEFLIKKGREQKKKSKWVSRWVGLGFGDLWFNLCLLFQLPFQLVLARLTWAAPSVSARRCLCQLFHCFSALPREQTG